MGENGECAAPTKDPQMKDPQTQVNDCAKEIEDVLKRHQCFLDAEFILAREGVRPTIKIRTLPQTV